MSESTPLAEQIQSVAAQARSVTVDGQQINRRSDGATKPIVENSPVMFDSGVLGGGSLGSSVMGGEGIHPAEPSAKHHHAHLKVYVDAGAADQATIRDLFLALSAVYEVHRGSGLTVTKHRQRTLVGEEVLV